MTTVSDDHDLPDAESASYDAWFRAQVQAAIDDPRASIPHEEVKARFDERKKALREGIQKDDDADLQRLMDESLKDIEDWTDGTS